MCGTQEANRVPANYSSLLPSNGPTHYTPLLFFVFLSSSSTSWWRYNPGFAYTRQTLYSWATCPAQIISDTPSLIISWPHELVISHYSVKETEYQITSMHCSQSQQNNGKHENSTERGIKLRKVSFSSCKKAHNWAHQNPRTWLAAMTRAVDTVQPFGC